MRKNKLVLSGLLSMLILGSAAIPANAAGFGSQVTIDAKATTVNVTVPSSAPMVFNADGTNTVPTNFNITNNSEIGGVHLESISLAADTTGNWKLVNDTVDLKTQAKNTKNIRLKMGASGAEKLINPTSSSAHANGSATFGASDFAIPAKGSKTLSFKVERGAFTTAIPSAKAFDMTLNFDFN